MKNFPFLFSILLITTCKNGGDKINPTIETISESVYASGIVKSKNQYQVYSTVNGLIQQIMVSEGDTVEKDAPLMKVLNYCSYRAWPKGAFYYGQLQGRGF